jgi:hypothetical protein
VLPDVLTWDNGGGNSDWKDRRNWEPEFVPHACTDCVIPDVSSMHDYPIVDENDAVCRNLYVEPKGEITINLGSTLTMHGNARIRSDADDRNGSMIAYGTLAGGSVTYQRFLQPNRWYIAASPVNVISGFNTQTNQGELRHPTLLDFDFAIYNERNNTGWEYPPALPDLVEKGRGYASRTHGGGIVSFAGSLNSDVVTVRINDTGQDGTFRDGWNSIGNPYTSAIRIYDFLNQNRPILEPWYEAVYVWYQPGSYTLGEQHYKALNLSGYTWSGFYGISTLDPPGLVQVGQGFLVNAEADPAMVDSYADFVFNRSMQTHQTTVPLKAASKSWPGVTLLAIQGDQTRATFVGFNENMTTRLDTLYDAGLLPSNGFQVYTRAVQGNEDIDLEIQSLPEDYDNLIIPVGVDLPQGGEVTFKLAGVIMPDGVWPVLEDRLLKVNTTFRVENDSYTATLPKETHGPGRFFLRFGTVTNTKIVNLPESDFSARFTNDRIIISGNIKISAKATLFDMNGRKLGEYTLNGGNRNEIPASGLSNGMYLLQIRGDKKMQVIKVPVVYD